MLYILCFGECVVISFLKVRRVGDDTVVNGKRFHSLIAEGITDLDVDTKRVCGTGICSVPLSTYLFICFLSIS